MRIVIFLISLPVFVFSLVEEDVMPSELQDCYSTQISVNELETQNNCLGQYLSNLFGNTSYNLVDKKAMAWIDSLGRRLHIRLKRQTGGYYHYNRLRVRKEIRTLTDSERRDFFEAINALKYDTSEKPNKYDAFALLHQNASLPSAHRGPNFLGWHRYYLLLFEEALRTKRRNVVLPYWDSSFDFTMPKPEETVLFTELFFGNGQGVVYTGPFALWRTPSQNTYLRRDIPGPRSSLIDPVKIQNVFNKRRHSEIVHPTAASDMDNIESHHDGVHRWIGGRDGHMGGLDTSPQDPVFWVHHCYVDYLWEKFREHQIRMGINPETDYPEIRNASHHPTRLMDNLLPPMTNIEGYSNSFTRNIYRYAPVPSCRDNCGRSMFLFCNRTTYQCESRSRKQFEDMKGFQNVDYRPYVSNLQVSPQVNTNNANDSTANAGAVPTNFMEAMDMQVTTNNAIPTIHRHIHEAIIDPRTMTRKKRSSNFVVDSIDLTNKKTSDRELAAIPISIINEKTQYLNNINASNIQIQTIGVSYNGRHSDSIHIDERTRYSKSVALATFEKPELGETKVYIRVNNLNGNVCRPQCLIPATTQEATYHDCTGFIKITPDMPRMYFEMDSTNDMHTDSTYQEFIRFYCGSN